MTENRARERATERAKRARERALDRASERAADRRENRRRRKTRTIVPLIALVFVLPVFMALAPVNIPVLAETSDPIYVEACYGWYSSHSYNYWYMNVNDGFGWMRWDIEDEIGEDKYITGITLYIYSDGAGSGYVDIAEVDAFDGVGGASELDGATAITGNPPGDVILSYAQGGGSGYKSSSDAALTTWANDTYQSDGHLYLGMNHTQATGPPSESYNYPPTWPITNLPYVVVTYEAIGWAPTITSSPDTTAIVDKHYSYTITANESATFSAELGDSETVSEDYCPTADRAFSNNGENPNAWSAGDSTSYASYHLNTPTYNDYKFVYFRFNLTDDGLPSDADIQNAYFQMYCSAGTSGATAYSKSLSTDDWPEMLNPTDMLALYPSGLSAGAILFGPTVLSTSGWHNYTSSTQTTNIDSQFAADGVVGLMLGAGAPTQAAYYYTYRSKEYAGTDYDPYLRLQYTLPPWLTFTPANATLWGTPTSDEIGDWDVNITATSDAGGFDAYQEFTVTVSLAAPLITNSPGTEAVEDAYYEWNATCTAADSGANDWDFSTNASFLSLTGETELNVTIGGTPDFDDIGEYWVNVTVEDGDSGDYENYTLDVTAWLPQPSMMYVSGDEYHVTDTDNGYGDSTLLALGYLYETLLRFDITVPGGETITEAYINLYNYAIPYPGNMTVYEAEGSQATLDAIGNNVTGDGHPTNGDELAEFYVDAFGWSNISLGSLTTLDTQYDTYGQIYFVLANATMGGYNSFRSNETTGSDYDPYLYIVYSGPGYPPVITNSPGTDATEDAYYEWNATCTAADSGSNDWTLDTNATFLSLTGETTSNVTVGGTPAYSDVGSFWVNLTVNDSDSSDFENYTLDVATWRWAPTFTNSGPTTCINNTLYSYDCDCNESVTFDLEGNSTSFLSIDAQGWVNGTPTVLGWYYVNISAESTAGTLTAWQNYSLDIVICSTYILRPNSDEFVQWDQTPSSGDHWEKVDETDDGGDGTSTYVDTNSVDDIDRWGLTDLPEASPCLGYDLSFWVIAENSAPGTANITYGVYIGTTYYPLHSFTPTNEWLNYSTQQNVSPATGVEWTFAEINAMHFYVTTSDPSPSVRVTQAAVLVQFHDAVAPIAVLVHGHKSVSQPAIDEDINFTYAESGIGVWFSPSYSSDNLGIVNYTTNITINEELFDTHYLTGGWGYRYATVGDYLINLTVRDDYGNSAYDEHTFTLNRSTILRPDADGTLSDLTGYPSDVDNYDDVQDAWYLDEVATHDGNTSYLYTPDTNTRYNYLEMDNFTGNHVGEFYNVTLFVWALETGPDSTLMEGLRNGTTTYWGPDEQALTETYVNYSYTWYVCPWTAVEWTTEDINATIVNIGIFDANPGGRITKVGIIIDIYPPDLVDPVADAGPDQNVTRGDELTFDGSGSSDDIGVANWTWTFTYNETATTLYGETVNFTFHTIGTYVVTLTVYDAFGNSDNDEMTVVVGKPDFGWVEWGATNFTGFVAAICLVGIFAALPIGIYLKRRSDNPVKTIIMVGFVLCVLVMILYGCVVT